MTNYESTVYTVEDEEQDTSAAFSTLPARDDNNLSVAAGAAVMKLGHTAELPDGQSINVSVLFTLDDVRGLQSYLNDQFGRSISKQDQAAALARISDPAQVAAVVGIQNPEPRSWDDPNADPMADVRTMQDQIAASYDLRQCPVIYNGVQCYKAEGHTEQPGHEALHEFVSSFLPQTGDGTTPPPAADPGSVQLPEQGVAAAESATAARTAEAPSPSIPNNGYDKELWAAEEQMEKEHPTGPLSEPAKKKVNRRKKEEKAYDDALEVFRKQPNSQLEYTALTQAAEALRKRFPDAERLVAYDLHVQHQDTGYLTGSTPVEQTPANPGPEYSDGYALPGEQTGPQFAPEPVAAQPAPFVPPATTNYMQQANHPNVQAMAMANGGYDTEQTVSIPPAEQQSAEELQAAAAFPCQHKSEVSGRQCTRPAGHEHANPPKPHIYGELQQGQSLPAVPNFIPPFQPPAASQPGFTVTPVGDGQGFTQQTLPPFQIPQPATTATTQGAQVLSFQVPPTPDGAEMQPPAPAAPPWGGQQ